METTLCTNMLKFIFNFNTNLKFTSIFSILCIMSSVGIQYILNETPCLLCLLTRICFVIVTITCFCTMKYQHIKWIQSLPLLMLSVLFFLSFYHLGIENHWWVAPESCKMKLPTLDNLGAQNLVNDRPPCDTVGFQIFGISMTLFSFVISGALTWLHSIAFVLRKFS